ncbi:BnaA01g18780D [Brassica napus]|uniref:BnaA01g18780D protein n=1 Tax=Brassica napus TaxID=3708 RepID=A0A078G943_BRANA|nr:BnaA01g18780D [Brassica napus]
MDKISQLPDELLLKVLLFLPTKVAVSTSILSIQAMGSLSRFINLNMPLHRAPVIESLRLNFSHGYTGSVTPEDVRQWVALAVTRFLRELSLDLTSEDNPTKLPSSLYTCKSLVILELKGSNLVDVHRTSCLPSLKTLLLQGVLYADQKSLHKLLSSCPVLEDLFVEQYGCESEHFLEAVSVIVPSLQRLTLKLCRGYFFHRLVINTPSLKYFKIEDYTYEHTNGIDDDDYSFYSDDMPKLEEMEVHSTYLDIQNFVSLITHVKRLSLCLPDQAENALYREGIVLSQLRRLKLCSCTINWSKLLVRLLKDSPNLQELEIHLDGDHTNICEDPPVCWENELACVPDCLLSSLQTFKWTRIYGSPKEVDLVKYVLRNARCLKTPTIFFKKFNQKLKEIIMNQDMDKISPLPDELLLKVLLLLPTKVAASTSILSKRWEFLWMWLPKLAYDDSMDEHNSLLDFITLNMPQHRAPVIESLRLSFSYGYKGSVTREDIRMWVAIAVTRFLRELSLDLTFEVNPTKLPSSMYTCKSLVILELEEGILVDVPRTTCLPSLKTLLLQGVTYADQKSLHRLLSSCPVLDDLFVKHNGCESEHLKTFSVIVPSLQRLTLKICRGSFFKALVMNTPSLKYFKFTDYTCEHHDFSDTDIDFDFDYNGYSFYSDDMPKLEEMEVDSTYLDTENFVSLITHVKRLSLCLPDQAENEKALYREGIVFSQLRRLKLCSCTINWSKLLVRLLKDSPNLQELEIHLDGDHTNICEDPPVCWENELACVPDCLLSSLQTFKWTRIYGSQKEVDLVKYVLSNARCLKTATILFRSSDSALEEDELEMVIQDLSLSSRGSKYVKLVFV